MAVLLSLRGTLAVTSLSSLPVYLLAYFVSHVPLNAWFGIYVAFALYAHILWHSVGALVFAIVSNVDILADPTSSSTSPGMAAGDKICE